MVATFILTRAFAISALFVGAFTAVDATPLPAPAPSVLDTVLAFSFRLKHESPAVSPGPGGLVAQAPPGVKRSCRQQGCLREVAVAPARRDGDLAAVTEVGVVVAEVSDSVKMVAPDVVAVAAPDEKRSCRPMGCLRELAAGGTPPSIDAFARAPREEAVSADQASADVTSPGAEAAVRRSCRQQGCLRELDPVDAGTPSVEEQTKEARSCRQVGCLRALPVDAREPV